MHYLPLIGLSILTSLGTIVVAYNYAPIASLEVLEKQPIVGSTITTINGSDTISSSRAVINTNFSNLNTDKAELAVANSFTALNNFSRATSTIFSCTGPCYFGATATSSFSTAGALTLITPLTVANGGTGSTTLSQFSVLLGSTTNAIGMVRGLGTSGQLLTSNGAGVAPTWQSASFDTSINYTNTGLWTFNATTTMATSTAASSTITTANIGTLTVLNNTFWRLISSTTTTQAMNIASTSLPSLSDIRIIIHIPSLTVQSSCIQFNFDTGSNYAWESSMNYGVRNPGSNSGSILLDNTGGATTTDATYDITIRNDATLRKFVTWNGLYSNSAANAPYHIQGSGVWNNTSNAVSSIQLNNAASACGHSVPSGTKIRVYGQ